MEYPLMIYKGCDLAADWRIVADREGEEAAAKDGYGRHGSEPKEKKQGSAKKADPK